MGRVKFSSFCKFASCLGRVRGSSSLRLEFFFVSRPIKTPVGLRCTGEVQRGFGNSGVQFDKFGQVASKAVTSCGNRLGGPCRGGSFIYDVSVP